MLASRLTKRVVPEHEPDAWFEIRMLPGKKLDEAQRAHQRLLLAEWGDVIAKLDALGSRSDAAAPDALAGFDVDVLNRAGVVAWSYSDKPTAQEIEDLDDTTRRWLAREILEFSRPSGDARKNG
jgi:hypothetical protein